MGGPATLRRMDLDHVALALQAVGPTLDALTGELGAVVGGGGQSVGFRIVQVRVGTLPDPAQPDDHGQGMTIELMEPWVSERFDFLARFLASNGEGPHHMTFKVDGIEDEIARLEAAGYSPVRTQLTNPWWREAFYHPKQTFGTVIQVAEPSFRPDLVTGPDGDGSGDGDFGSIEWWPEPAPRAEHRAILRRVVLGVPDVGAAATFFSDVMHATVESKSEAAVGLAWAGGGRITIEHRPDRPPGVDRYECEAPGEPKDLMIGGVRVVVGPPD